MAGAVVGKGRHAAFRKKLRLRFGGHHGGGLKDKGEEIGRLC